MLCLCNNFARVHNSCSCGMSCFILISRKGPAGAGRKGEDGGEKGLFIYNCRKGPAGAGRRGRRCKCMLFIVGRGRREPVGGGRRCYESSLFL